jgi:hypothetical protein
MSKRIAKSRVFKKCNSFTDQFNTQHRTGIELCLREGEKKRINKWNKARMHSYKNYRNEHKMGRLFSDSMAYSEAV